MTRFNYSIFQSAGEVLRAMLRVSEVKTAGMATVTTPISVTEVSLMELLSLLHMIDKYKYLKHNFLNTCTMDVSKCEVLTTVS